MDEYLSPVPRGLHHVAIKVLRRELAKEQYHLTIEQVAEPVVAADEYDKHLLAKLGKKDAGSIYDDSILKKHVNVGFYREKDASDAAAKCIWTLPGVWEGSVWLKITTNAPASKLASIKVLGPLLACVKLFDNLKLTGPLEEVSQRIRELLSSNDYNLDVQGLNLWKRHACEWGSGFQIPDKTLRFRVTCIRSHAKEYLYERQEFLNAVVDAVVPPDNIMPKEHQWVVDLTNYDLEIMLMLLSPTCFAIGFSLRPYQLLGCNSFHRNAMPPDISPPYLGISGISRLRPTNAHLLLELANIQRGEIVLDPCVGIGTIPFCVESGGNGVGLGGDLCLADNDDEPAGEPQKEAALLYSQKLGRGTSASNLCVWDAGALPIRDASIDVIVSDLPFGQQCLSSGRLHKFLPIWLSEFARVLSTSPSGGGRMVLLCGGSHSTVVGALQEVNWTITCVFPVNIGGLLAWVVMARRKAGKAVLLPNGRQQLKKLTAHRERIAKSIKVEVARKKVKTSR
jgi:hypothetical protein